MVKLELLPLVRDGLKAGGSFFLAPLKAPAPRSPRSIHSIKIAILALQQMVLVSEQCGSYPNIIAKINRLAGASVQSASKFGKFVALHFRFRWLGGFLSGSMEVGLKVGVFAVKLACKGGCEIKEIDIGVIIPISDEAPAFTN
ncbi:hypothetical protein M527_21085 [Sphingobium indicum IP26]|uniref:Uncharacterized protein n=1 Tax=Sphingobium indicum F2 TaxID=1450518 RepID=A0A8E1C1L5_9SPHN|nr:hypothetical protein M527_21085 [Sphingobium indicum IP26]KER35078.1 hypothetical protein AL00_18080 [Sphingobium indicum F2]